MQAEYGWLALVTARPLGVCRVCTLFTYIPSHIYAHMATQARLGPQVMAQRTALLQQLLSALQVHVCMVVQGQLQYVVEA